MPALSDVQKHYDAAFNFYNQYNYEAAEKEIIQAISQNEADENYHYLHYQILIALNKWTEAEKELLKSNQQKIIVSEFYNGWGNDLYNQKGNGAAAEEKYKKAIEYNPDSYVDYRNLGLALSAQGKTTEAINAFKKSIEVSEKLNPAEKYKDAYYSLSLELGKTGNWEEGESTAKSGNLSNIDLSFFYNAWGNYLYNEKDDPVNAKVNYQKAIEYNPDSFFVYRNLGLALSKQGKTTEAINAFKKSIEVSEKLNPAEKYKDAYYSLSLELGKAGDWEEGESTANKGDLSNIDLSFFYNTWGNYLYNEKGDAVNAKEKYQKAIEHNPDSFIDYRNLGLALSKQGKTTEAINEFKKSIEVSEKLNPAKKYEDAYVSLSLELGIACKWQEAESEIKKANVSDDNLSIFYNAWGNALYNNKENEKAEEKYRKAIEYNAKSFIYYRNLGLSLSAQKRTSEAIDAFKQSAEISEKINPATKYQDAYLSLALELGKTGKWKEALTELQKCNPSNNNLSEFYNAWGSALYNDDRDYINSEEKFRKAIEYNETSFTDYNNIGLALMQQNRFAEAEDAFKKCISINENYAFAFENLAFLFHKQKMYDEAFTYLDKALAITPDSNWALFRKGLIYEEKKQYEDAISFYEKILKLDSSDAFAQHNIANIYWNLGLYEQGRKKWADTIKIYQQWELAQKPVEKDENFYLYYGGIQNSIFGLSKEAETIYKKGLQLDPENYYILWALGNLYKQMSEEDEDNKPALLWKSRECFSKTRAILEKRIITQPVTEPALLNDITQLFLDSGDFKSAAVYMNDAKSDSGPVKKSFTEILSIIEEADPDSSSVKSLIGVYYTRVEDYKKAADYFRQSLSYDADNLSVWSNLAETYLNLNQFEEAYKEYSKLLRKAPCHVESLIGLGECCIRFGEKGDGDFYELAVKNFDTASDLSRIENGSKILRNKEKATLMYSRGLARVKIYENSKNIRLNNLLQMAFRDFNESYRIDKDKYKSKIASEKVTQRLKLFSSQRITEKLGPTFIFSLSLFVFICIQVLFIRSYFFKKGISIDFTSYSLFTFGTLIFMIAALYLPNVLKLKVAGIELEKSSIDLISTSGSLGISRDIGSFSSTSAG